MNLSNKKMVESSKVNGLEFEEQKVNFHQTSCENVCCLSQPPVYGSVYAMYCIIN